MRLNIDLDDELFRRGHYRLQWRSEKGRLLSGVNLDSREALFDLMNGRK